MENNLRISNMVVTGKIPLKRRLNEKEVKSLIMSGKFDWMIINEDMSPIIQTSIEKEGITVRGRPRKNSISLWTSGAINIVGITSMKEANKIYLAVLGDIMANCRRAFYGK